MKTSFLLSTVCMFGLLVQVPGLAAPINHGPVSHVAHVSHPQIHVVPAHSSHFVSFNQVHGTRFAHGYFYRGGSFRWTNHRWDARYSCWCYFDPCNLSWY